MFLRWKIAAAVIALFAAGSLGLVGCSSTPAPASAPSPAPAPAPAKVAGANLYLTILTGEQDGKTEWPTFSPGNFTVPADTDVTVTVRNYDDGMDPVPAEDAKVMGTIGNNMKIYDQMNGIPDETKAKTVTELDVKAISHTITFNNDNFKLNVPIPPTATVVFSFHTPKAGSYQYRCLSACATGADGTEGAMATDGWMRGVMTVK